MWNLEERGGRLSTIPTFLTHIQTVDCAFVLSLLCLLYTPFFSGLLPGPTLYYLRFFEFAVLYFWNSLPVNALRGPFLHLLQALHRCHLPPEAHPDYPLLNSKHQVWGEAPLLRKRTLGKVSGQAKDRNQM